MQTKSLSQIVLSWCAAAQAACTQALDFSVGSVNLAIAEANATLGLWMQKVALQVLSLSRFATSQGPDADSWGAQFGFSRLGAAPASGQETFYSANLSGAIIPVGGEVQTEDGSWTFSVTIDTTNLLYSSSPNIGPNGGYVLPEGQASIVVPVAATQGGRGGNVGAGFVTVLLTPIDGISSVSNGAAFLNGLDAESDAAYKARFPMFLAGLGRANYAAFVSAIQSVQQNLVFDIEENQNVIGSSYSYYDALSFFDRPGGFANPTLVPSPGMVLVVVDDGSGTPSQGLLNQVTSALLVIRALGIRVLVLGPVIVTANVTFNFSVAVGYSKTTLTPLANAAVQNWLNSRQLGTTLVPLSRIPQVIYDAVAGITNVTNVMINGQSTDLELNFAQVVKAGVIQGS